MNKAFEKFGFERAERYANNWRGLWAQRMFCFVLTYITLVPHSDVAGWPPQAEE